MAVNAHLQLKSRKLVNNEMYWVITKTLALIAIYFVLSIGITFYQRWMLESFHYPLSVVVCHLSLKFILAAVCRSVWQYYTKKPRALLEWTVYIKKVGLAGIAGGLDIGLSNWGLHLITVSLYTMTKSTVIIFILGFSLVFQLEKKSWTSTFIVVMISCGLFLFTYNATEFNLEGFLLVLAASFSSGLRWTVAQLLMQKSELHLSNPVDILYHIQPWMILSVLPLAIGFEGKMIATSCQMFRYSDSHLLLDAIAKVLLGGFVAFFMEISEFLVVHHTSSLTLSIAGICKEIFTLVLAVEWAGDQISFIKIIGLILCLTGISCHSYRKAIAIKNDHLADGERISENEKVKHTLSNSEDHTPLLSDMNNISARYLSDNTCSEGEESDEDSSVIFNMLHHSTER